MKNKNHTNRCLQIIIYSLLLAVFPLLVFTCKNNLVEKILEPRIITFNTREGSPIESQTVIKGNKIIKPENPTKDNAVFGGWYMEEINFSNQIPWDFDTEPSGDMTLHAAWLSISIDQTVINFPPNVLSPKLVTVKRGTDLPISGGLSVMSSDPDSFIVEENIIHFHGDTAVFYVRPNIGLTNGKTATITVSGENGISAKINASYGLIHINNVDIMVFPPHVEQTPNNIATASRDVNFNIINPIIWSPDHNRFQKDTSYTVNVKLEADNNYTFADLDAANVKINNNPAEIIFNTGTSIELKYIFLPTGDKAIARIEITGDPKLTYSHGELFNLNGLVIKLIYNDGPDDILEPKDFALNKLIINPITLGTIIHYSDMYDEYNNTEVTVHAGEISVNAGKLTIKKADIENVDIFVVTPVTGSVPNLIASGSGNFTIDDVVWNPTPSNNRFEAGGNYTATVKLTADENYIFIIEGFSATINADEAEIGNNNGTTVTLSRGFVTTDVRSKIIIKQPTLEYIHGDRLDLSELEVELSFIDNSKEIITFANFGAYHIRTIPANGELLRRPIHNGTTVRVFINDDKSIETDDPLTVNIKPITIDVTAQDRIYNGTNIVTLANGMLQGVVTGDIVGFELGTGIINDSNIGLSKPVTTAITLNGTDAGYYTLIQPTNVRVNITPAPLTISGATATNRQYNGSEVVIITGGTLVGVLNGDDVGLNPGIGLMTDAKVGNGKQVYTNFTLTGTMAANYILIQPNNITVNITPAVLTVSGVTHTKKYDGTTDVIGDEIEDVEFSGIINSDFVSAGIVTAFYTNENAGTQRINITAISLEGTDAANYTVTLPVNNVIVTNGIIKADGWPVGQPTFKNAFLTGNQLTIDVNVVDEPNAPGNGQTVEYAISIANDGTGLSDDDWQPGTSFNGLTVGITYYVYARSASNNNFNEGEWNISEPITIHSSNFTIQIKDIIDFTAAPVISSGLILSRSGIHTTTISLEDSTGYDIEWRYNSETLGTGQAITLSVSQTHLAYRVIYDNIGKHFLVVIAQKDGIPYSKRIEFEVRP